MLADALVNTSAYSPWTAYGLAAMQLLAHWPADPKSFCFATVLQQISCVFKVRSSSNVLSLLQGLTGLHG